MVVYVKKLTELLGDVSKGVKVWERKEFVGYG